MQAALLLLPGITTEVKASCVNRFCLFYKNHNSNLLLPRSLFAYKQHKIYLFLPECILSFTYRIITAFFCVFLLQKSSLAQNGHGIHDTIKVDACIEANGDTIPCSWLPSAYVFTKETAKSRKMAAQWTRLRNAVYVTYPYAVKASQVMNEINARLANETDKKKTERNHPLPRKRSQKRICRQTHATFCLPGKSVNETYLPANRQQLLRNHRRIQRRLFSRLLANHCRCSRRQPETAIRPTGKRPRNGIHCTGCRTHVW